jgi:wyosine [tRNA(Phe)-imidazoG37] synthetase (radical SAM superfamily)
MRAKPSSNQTDRAAAKGRTTSLSAWPEAGLAVRAPLPDWSYVPSSRAEAAISPTLRPSLPSPSCCGTASGCPRENLGNRFVYTVISPRARGLSVGLNLNPDKRCNFDCVYCEVNRSSPARNLQLDVSTMVSELERTLESVRSGEIRRQPGYLRVPPEVLQLRHVALSGDGEPTLSRDFAEVVEAVVHLRAGGRFPFFKLVLITNACGLHRPEVAQALNLLTSRDEIWAKLEAGTQGYMDRVNRPDRVIEQVIANILQVAQRRPVVIQSLFPAIGGGPPPASEIDAFAGRLHELKQAGALIRLVQIYSATRSTANPACGHLPLRVLSQIARRVRQVSGLPAEVF